MIKKSYVYILTNKRRTVLYTGVTSNLEKRIREHREGYSTFTSKYNVFHLIYFEEYNNITEAIRREKEIKSWRREKKENLINKFNPSWKFLEKDIFA